MSQTLTPRPVEKEDLFRLRFLQGAKLSPDGTAVAYVVSKTDAAKDEETSAIYFLSLDTGVSRQLTAGLAKDGNPQWSPDGKTIAFTSTRGGAPQIFLLPVDGGEPRQLTSVKLGVGAGPVWSPDGRQIAFTTSPLDAPPDPTKPYRVTRNVPRFDMLGYVHIAVQEIYVIPVAGGEPKRLTTADYVKQPLAWSPDGAEILFTASLYPDSFDHHARLCAVDMNGSVREIVHEWGGAMSAAYVPDGRRIAFIGQPRGMLIGSKNDLWVVDRSGGVPQCRTAGLKVGVGGGLQPDMPLFFLLMPSLSLTKDGRAAIVGAQEGGTVRTYRIELDGPESWKPVLLGDRTCFVVDVGAREVLYLVSDFNLPCDLCIANLDGSNERWLTHLNDEVLAGFRLPAVEHLLFPGVDGAQVEGWFYKPPEGRAPYPTILYIHGGPHSAFGHIYHFDSQMLCGAGYGVLMVNHRASTGYGNQFATAIKGDWGNLDYKDLMAGVDVAVAKGLADRDRLGVCGISGGGNLSCWIVGQTNRFKAAVPENPVTNWVSFYGVSDIGPFFSVEELGGKPHEVPDTYAKCSPITFAHRCRTPTLLVQGEMDFRCPAEQSEQFYAVLKANGCTVEMVRLPNSPHTGSMMAGLPIRKAQNDALLEWMNRYVMGK